jgi:hypothetical protein
VAKLKVEAFAKDVPVPSGDEFQSTNVNPLFTKAGLRLAKDVSDAGAFAVSEEYTRSDGLSFSTNVTE